MIYAVVLSLCVAAVSGFQTVRSSRASVSMMAEKSKVEQLKAGDTL